MRRALAAALIFTHLASAAHADVYDYGFRFSDIATAIADGETQGFYSQANSLSWSYDHVIPGLQCWNPSADSTITNPTPPPSTFTTHTYLTGYFVLVSTTGNLPNPALAADPNLLFILDRTERETGSVSFVVVNNIGAGISDLACSPMFASSNPYPVGGYQ